MFKQYNKKNVFLKKKKFKTKPSPKFSPGKLYWILWLLKLPKTLSMTSPPGMSRSGVCRHQLGPWKFRWNWWPLGCSWTPGLWRSLYWSNWGALSGGAARWDLNNPMLQDANCPSGLCPRPTFQNLPWSRGPHMPTAWKSRGDSFPQALQAWCALGPWGHHVSRCPHWHPLNPGRGPPINPPWGCLWTSGLLEQNDFLGSPLALDAETWILSGLSLANNSGFGQVY